MFTVPFRLVASAVQARVLVKPLWSRFLCIDVEPMDGDTGASVMVDADGKPIDADGKPFPKGKAPPLVWALVLRCADKVLAASESDKNAPEALKRAEHAVAMADAWAKLPKDADADAVGKARDAARAALVAVGVDTADLPTDAKTAVKLADKRLSHAKEMKAPLFWSDEAGASRAIVLAHFAGRADADRCAAALLSYYAADYNSTTDQDRYNVLVNADANAAALLPVLVALFGVRFSGQRVCKYAERDAAPARGKRSAEPTPTAALGAVNKLLAANADKLPADKRAEIEAALAALQALGMLGK